MTEQKLIKIRNLQMTVSSLMMVGGLYVAYKGKKSALGYIGFGLLGMIAGSALAYGVGSILIKDKTAVETPPIAQEVIEETVETGDPGSPADSVEQMLTNV